MAAEVLRNGTTTYIEGDLMRGRDVLHARFVEAVRGEQSSRDAQDLLGLLRVLGTHGIFSHISFKGSIRTAHASEGAES